LALTDSSQLSFLALALSFFTFRFSYPIPKHKLLEKAVANVRSSTTGSVPSHAPVRAIEGTGYECEGRADPETMPEVATHSYDM